MDLETAERRLLETAARLFNERGVQAVGMDDIRAASGVSLKRLYQVFPAKDRLVEAVLRERERNSREAIERHVRDYPSPRERVLGVFDWLYQWFREPDFRGCVYINSFGELGGTSDDVARIARAAKRELRDCIRELVAGAGLPKTLADQLNILANGAIVTAAIMGSPDAAKQARAAAAILLDTAGRT